jgi:hypothetical protein
MMGVMRNRKRVRHSAIREREGCVRLLPWRTRGRGWVVWIGREKTRK